MFMALTLSSPLVAVYQQPSLETNVIKPSFPCQPWCFWSLSCHSAQALYVDAGCLQILHAEQHRRHNGFLIIQERRRRKGWRWCLNAQNHLSMSSISYKDSNLVCIQASEDFLPFIPALVYSNVLFQSNSSIHILIY